MAVFTMPMEYNIYCDESCHLEHDGQRAMVLGCLVVPKNQVRRISEDIKKIKRNHGYPWEIKWTRVSTMKLRLYEELIDYFWTEVALSCRGVVVTDKSKLDHAAFNQGSHDAFYYKMFYQALVTVIEASSQYNIYLDMKDTRSAQRIILLRDILCAKFNDPTKEIIPKIQNMRSHESEIFGILDLLIGATAYSNRGLTSSDSKLALVKRVREKSGRSLRLSSFVSEKKFNLFQFDPQVRK